jgi:large repetitive protein
MRPGFLLHNKFSLFLLAILFVSGLAPFCAPSLHAAYVKRYTTIANGGMTYTGNTLGLSKGSNNNAPGTNGSIGTFITSLSSTSKDGTYPFYTTGLWGDNASSAVLRLPVGSTVLYAELIWGGSYYYGGEDVSGSLDKAVSFTTPGGSSSVSPSPSTKTTISGSDFYYVRSADVTSIVQAAGAGTYTVGAVPGTQGSSENNANAAGWTLAVIYGNASLPARNMTIFVGGELTSSSVSTTSSVSGFCTPTSGTISARMMVSAIEGDSDLTGDQMRFGPTTGTMAAVSGPNNPSGNFFCSQINKDDGTLDTAGTFGTSNHTPGSNSSGRRQGWDITNVDVSARMTSNQSIAYARGTTSGDRYTISTIGLQINVGAPIFPTAVMSVDKATTYVGDTLTYTVSLNNTTGSANALNVIFTDSLPAGTVFVANSFKIGGVTQTGANPVSGVNLGTITSGTSKTVSYQAQVTAIPAYPAVATYNAQSSWTYQYQSCAGFPLNNGTTTTNVATTGIVRLQPTKTAVPPGGVSAGGTVTYTITIPNTGTADSSGTTLLDAIPAGTTYVAGSTTLNGSLVQDATGGVMPFATTATLVKSPTGTNGQIKSNETATIVFKVTINPSPPPIITNSAYIDPDGPTGPVPAIRVDLSNPPVKADLAVAITDNQTTAVAGTAVTYVVTVTNNGGDSGYSTVYSLNLSVPLPSTIINAVWTPSTGSYSTSTGEWTGLTLAMGQSITLTIAGTIASTATGTLTVPATVTPAPGVQDTNTGNNTASDEDTLTYQADLGVAITDGQTAVTPGSALTYTITVTNNGPSQVGSLNVVFGTFPALFQSTVFTPAQGIYNETTGLWTGLNLTPGQSVILTLRGTVDPTFTGALVITVTVSPPTGVTDSVSANDTAQDTDTTTPLMTLVKSVDHTSALPGDELIFTVYYHNVGGSGATNLVISDTVPANTTYVPGSLKMGDAASTYATATPLADTGRVSGTSIIYTIPSVAADDGFANSGNDEGKVYFKAKVN